MSAPDARRALPVSGLVAVVVLVSVAAGGFLIARGGNGSDTPAGSSTAGAATPADSEAARAAQASAALGTLERAVEARDERAFRRVFADTAAAVKQATRLFATLSRLPLSSYSTRYIAEIPANVGLDRGGRTGGGAWLAEVEVHWALRGYDDREIGSEVEVTFTSAGERARIGAIKPAAGERSPMWLLGRWHVQRAGPALVLSARPEPGRQIADELHRSVRDVRAVLPSWDGRVVVLAPGRGEDMERLLGGPSDAYGGIAAVTATADGTSDPAAPVRIVLNPPVFRDLGPTAGRVVLAHEATHAATDATVANDVPLWLVEGFADYVALADDPVSLEVAASQIFAQVRRAGPPDSLPTRDDFATTAHGLGASYEAAWLACRMIAERYGEDDLVDLYERTESSGSIAAAFGSELETDVETFTAQWRDYLRGLAR